MGQETGTIQCFISQRNIIRTHLYINKLKTDHGSSEEACIFHNTQNHWRVIKFSLKRGRTNKLYLKKNLKPDLILLLRIGLCAVPLYMTNTQIPFNPTSSQTNTPYKHIQQIASTVAGILILPFLWSGDTFLALYFYFTFEIVDKQSISKKAILNLMLSRMQIDEGLVSIYGEKHFLLLKLSVRWYLWLVTSCSVSTLLMQALVFN